MKSSFRKFVVLVMCLLLSGCAGYQDFTHQRAIRKRANMAFAQCVCPEQMRITGSHFEDGWIAGYMDVANGSCGKKRPFAPSKYYTLRYQTDQGQQMLADWHCGYEEGTQYALNSDASRFHVIPNLSGASLPCNEPILPDWYFAGTQTARLQQTQPDSHVVDEYYSSDEDAREEDAPKEDASKKDESREDVEKDMKENSKSEKTPAERKPEPTQKENKSDNGKPEAGKPDAPAKKSDGIKSPSDIIEEPTEPKGLNTSTSRRRNSAASASRSFSQRIREITADVKPAGFLDERQSRQSKSADVSPAKPTRLKELLSIPNVNLQRLLPGKSSSVGNAKPATQPAVASQSDQTSFDGGKGSILLKPRRPGSRLSSQQTADLTEKPQTTRQMKPGVRFYVKRRLKKQIGTAQPEIPAAVKAEQVAPTEPARLKLSDTMMAEEKAATQTDQTRSQQLEHVLETKLKTRPKTDRHSLSNTKSSRRQKPTDDNS